MIGIYKITNLINGKCYIGKSIDIEKRFQKHKTNAFWKSEKNLKYNYPLYQAFRKYTLQNFSFEVLEECSENELNNKEQFYYNLFKPEYCLTSPDENVVLNLNVRKKISESLKGKVRTVEHCQNISKSLKYEKNVNSKKVRLYKTEDEIYLFDSTSLAAKWLIEEKYTSSTKERVVSQMVSRAARKERKTVCGFIADYV